MDEIRARFTAQVAALLSAARDSAAKEELIEELSDDLCLRYQDQLAAGLSEQEAYRAALNSLGDVAELMEYLDSLSPREGREGAPLNGLLDDLEDIGKNVFSRVRGAVEDARRPSRREDGEEPSLSEAVFPAVDLRGIDVSLPSGEISVRFSRREDEDVLLSGDMARLEVSLAADGVLTVRPNHAGSSTFRLGPVFLGAASQDVELCLPCRDWDLIRLRVANGEIDLNGGCWAGEVSVKAANGDIRGQLAGCDRLSLTTANGDIEWRGDVGEASAESVSGDLRLEGSFRRLTASSVSGDLNIAGSSVDCKGSSISGDVYFESKELPASLVLSSRSGDCELRLPAGAFTARLSTVSGDVDSFLPLQKDRGGMICGSGGGPVYTVSTLSGDIGLRQA